MRPSNTPYPDFEKRRKRRRESASGFEQYLLVTYSLHIEGEKGRGKKRRDCQRRLNISKGPFMPLCMGSFASILRES